MRHNEEKIYKKINGSGLCAVQTGYVGQEEFTDHVLFGLRVEQQQLVPFYTCVGVARLSLFFLPSYFFYYFLLLFDCTHLSLVDISVVCLSSLPDFSPLMYQQMTSSLSI